MSIVFCSAETFLTNTAMIQALRRQRILQKELRNFQNALKEGDKVVTGGGVYGVVKRIDLNAAKVEVEIARGVTIEVDKAYIFPDTKSMPQA